MGDRCYFKIYVNKKNQDDALRVIYHGYSASADEYVKEEEGGAVSIVDYEMNYGGDEERAELSNMGIPFYGSHGGGGEYGPCSFAGYGGYEVTIETDHSGFPVVRVDVDTLQVDGAALGDIEEYRKILQQAMDAVHER